MLRFSACCGKTLTLDLTLSFNHMRAIPILVVCVWATHIQQVAQLSLTRATRCITENGNILKQLRDHNHAPFLLWVMSSCC